MWIQVNKSPSDIISHHQRLGEARRDVAEALRYNNTKIIFLL